MRTVAEEEDLKSLLSLPSSSTIPANITLGTTAAKVGLDTANQI
jgi:hypothetical protein